MTTLPTYGLASSTTSYICIECTHPVASLYTPYSNADDRSLGRGVRLTQCPRCKRFADKYVEHDFVVLFIDLVLIKPQVYRHLLFNRLGRQDGRIDPSVIRLGILLLLFDVYLTWARIEKESPPDDTVAAMAAGHQGRFGGLNSQPIMVQYLFFLLLCLMQTLLSHLSIRILARLLHHISPTKTSTGITPSTTSQPHPPSPPHANAISTALLVSSCTKLFPILMVIWDYDVPAAAKSVGWAVVVNNVEALRVLLGTGYLRAGVLALVGEGVRVLVGWGVVMWAGIGGGEWRGWDWGWGWEWWRGVMEMTSGWVIGR